MNGLPEVISWLRPATMAALLVRFLLQMVFILSSLCSQGKVQPASHRHFNNHPLRYCQLVHPRAISWVQGCSIHSGVLSKDRSCTICELEKMEQKEYPSISLREKIGYPGDDQVALTGYVCM
jgi:hypothetical protein